MRRRPAEQAAIAIENAWPVEDGRERPDVRRLSCECAAQTTSGLGRTGTAALRQDDWPNPAGYAADEFGAGFDLAQYSGSAFDFRNSSIVLKPGAIDASVPARTW